MKAAVRLSTARHEQASWRGEAESSRQRGAVNQGLARVVILHVSAPPRPTLSLQPRSIYHRLSLALLQYAHDEITPQAHSAAGPTYFTRTRPPFFSTATTTTTSTTHTMTTALDALKQTGTVVVSDSGDFECECDWRVCSLRLRGLMLLLVVSYRCLQAPGRDDQPVAHPRCC